MADNPCGGENDCKASAAKAKKSAQEVICPKVPDRKKIVLPKDVDTCELRIAASKRINAAVVVKDGTKIRDLHPVELLSLGDADRRPSVLTKYWPDILGVVFGLSSGAWINFATRRPIFSGIHKYAVTTIGWVGGLKVFHHWRKQYYMEKDAVLRHYIEQHPNDWPPLTPKNIKLIPPRKKIGDRLYIEKWAPIR